VPGVKKLQEVEGFAAANLTQDDSVGPVAQRRFQEIPDGHGRHAVLFAAGLESNDVLLFNPYPLFPQSKEFAGRWE